MSDQDHLTEEPKREWGLGGIIFFAVLALILLYATGLMLWPFLSALIIAAITVVLTFPLYRRLCKRLRGRVNLAASIMLIGVTLFLILPAFFLGILLVQQANSLFQHLQSIETQQLVQRIDLAARLHWFQRWIPGFDPSALSPQKMILPLIREVPGWVARNGAAILSGLAGAVAGFFLVLLASYFFYVEGETILAELERLSPLPLRYHREFGSRFKDVIDATFFGQVLCSISQGLATTIGFAIAGVPGAIFWGAVASVGSLLPLVGASIVWFPAAVYLFIDASMRGFGFGRAIFMVLWGFLVISTVDSIIRPFAMKGKAQMPAIPLLFAVIGGLQAFGFLGLVIGPLVFSLLMSIIDIYKRTFNAREDELS